jgi:hypothetical protein
MSQMPKASRASVSQVKDFGVAEDRSEDLGGYTVNFVSILQDHDLAPMLAGLPGGQCSCPHWGYVVKGKLTVRYGGRQDVIEAGEAFHSLLPGRADPPRAPCRGRRGWPFCTGPCRLLVGVGTR